MKDLYTKKIVFTPFPLIKDQFKNLRKFFVWGLSLRALFAEGIFKRGSHITSLSLEMSGVSPPPPFDDATLGGAVTFVCGYSGGADNNPVVIFPACQVDFNGVEHLCIWSRHIAFIE
jgi:hypothetical protein